MAHVLLGSGDTPLTPLSRLDIQGDSGLLGTSSWTPHRHLTLLLPLEPDPQAASRTLGLSGEITSALSHRPETWRSGDPFLSATSLPKLWRRSKALWLPGLGVGEGEDEEAEHRGCLGQRRDYDTIMVDTGP